ncbi:glutaredoxin family protein [Rugamonas sp.]|uniref:glutaredoxin family protein n=1 Tax=Rugamonas sp. TaxID=1926287 RepID=UPI0025FD48B2|nr:glutaredoxin family protein [Rugamonas sp.]
MARRITRHGQLALLLLAALAGMGGAGAQVYKWVDGKGVTHYSDAPPPPASKAKVEVKSFAGGGANPELPFELAEAAKNRPVTLYTTAQCDACNEARAMLMARGIPFREKTVATADDQAALKKAGSAGQLPLLLVGRSKQIGYEATAWGALLSEAGYPAEKMLPPNYQNGGAAPAAPPPQPSPEAQARAAAKAAAEEAARSQPLPAANAPPGFQF